MSDRNDSPLSARFAKNPFDENFLGLFNEHLQAFEEASYHELPESAPSIYVCGAPRSGTTLLTQAIASALDVQPVNNLVAAFWQAPCMGLRLSQKLLGGQFLSGFQSEYGRTVDIREPHEFGYFWSRLLGYSEMNEPDELALADVNWPRVRRVITNMQAVAKRPIVFKAFMPAFYAQPFCTALPRSLFVLVRRDAVENIASVHRGRIEYAGDESAWYSIRPAQCVDAQKEPPLKQSCMQVHYINQSLARIWRTLPSANVIEVDYENFCNDPQTVIRKIADALHALGAVVPLTNPLPTSFRSPSSCVEADLRSRIIKHLSELA